MKNVKIIVFLSAMAISNAMCTMQIDQACSEQKYSEQKDASEAICSLYVPEENEDDPQVKKLAGQLHLIASKCDVISSDFVKRVSVRLEFAHPEINSKQVWAALHIKINGKDVFEVIQESDSKAARVYMDILQDQKVALHYVIHDLKAGYLTREQFFADDELNQKLNEFRYNNFMKQN